MEPESRYVKLAVVRKLNVAVPKLAVRFKLNVAVPKLAVRFIFSCAFKGNKVPKWGCMKYKWCH